MNTDFPELHDFLGAYFHQDWTVEYETAEQALDVFLAESDIEDLRAVQKELNVLLSKKKNELELREYLLRELSCYYSYWKAWDTGEAWLLHIVNRLNLKISCS
ncbi:contact-dependent growth inhibition system immunity protein [Pseudomonas sp. P105]|uniref:contact-dependent growth inhibition system immunity protein n=1 Tax=Pseudomonas sp. P105 TaxID=3049542 RepID=UPI002934F716|nr:contact-dependent growth inhibition system immunity protein [Pseudomonas sp. P105]WNZ77154.1 contact-dependent growth inhibition system immunity protein [Pseudomonas sp. P105]